jgi:uncharacterized protein YndB with AHSA1/START domain
MSIDSHAHAAADLRDRSILGRVEIAASAERVFRALTSEEIKNWWIRPGVFNTTDWAGDVRVGGRWRAVGTGNGRPFTLEGEFLEIDTSKKLVLTWHSGGTPNRPTIVTFLLDRIDGGTRLTLEHVGFAAPDWCMNTCLGWETSLERLAEFLSAEAAHGTTSASRS